jgi:hypothetical protein
VHYIKSILVGFLAVLVVGIGSLIISSVVINRSSPPGHSIGIDPTGLAKKLYFWIVVLLAFAIGFYWQFRRRT